MQIAFGVLAAVFLQVCHEIALLRACPFVVGQFIVRQLTKYFIKLHQPDRIFSGNLEGFKTLLNPVGMVSV